ncbi:unnamed protein product [Musa textilis]
MLLAHLINSLHLSTAAAPGAYEVLRSHGLPFALLPKGAREFEVDDSWPGSTRLLHHQVRERGPLQRHPRRHHLPGPDRRSLRRVCPGPLPLVPRPRHQPRRQRVRHHPLRRWRRQ